MYKNYCKHFVVYGEGYIKTLIAAIKISLSKVEKTHGGYFDFS